MAQWTEARKLAQRERMKRLWREGKFKNTGKWKKKGKKRKNSHSIHRAAKPRTASMETILIKVLNAYIEVKVKNAIAEAFKPLSS